MAKNLSVLVILSSILSCVLGATSTPNIIFILADDLGYNDLSVYGSPTIDTPNIDSIAKNGARFTEFYLGASICSPSRSSMLTGRLAVRGGVYTKFNFPFDSLFRVFYPTSEGCLADSEITVAEALKNTYSSAMIGKWHLGHNIDRNCLPGDGNRGFDFFYGLPYSHEEGYPGPLPEGLVFPPVPLMSSGYNFVEQPFNQSDVTSRYTTITEQLIAKFGAAQTKSAGSNVVQSMHTEGEMDYSRPFFFHIAYENPHVPLFLSDNFQEGTSRRGLFGDSVEEMDISIGRIMKALEDAGIADNTLIAFSSDNGAWMNPNNGLNSNRPTKGMGPYDGGCNAPFFEGKGSTWEGGFRVPLVMSLPGKILPGQIIRTPVTGMDLFPTFLDYAQTPLPEYTLDGTSIRTLLETSVAKSVRASKQIKQKNALDLSYESLLKTGDLALSMDILDKERGDDLHKCIYFWREHTLHAIRCGQYKAHFVTRSGFNFSDPGTVHNPPLLFNVDWDPAEAIPMNASDSKYKLQTQYLQTQANLHVATVIKAPDEYQHQNYTRCPCCPRANKTETAVNGGVSAGDVDTNREVYLELTSAQLKQLQDMGWSSIDGVSIQESFLNAQRSLRAAEMTVGTKGKSVPSSAVVISAKEGVSTPWERCICARETQDFPIPI